MGSNKFSQSTTDVAIVDFFIETKNFLNEVLSNADNVMSNVYETHLKFLSRAIKPNVDKFFIENSTIPNIKNVKEIVDKIDQNVSIWLDHFKKLEIFYKAEDVKTADKVIHIMDEVIALADIVTADFWKNIAMVSFNNLKPRRREVFEIDSFFYSMSFCIAICSTIVSSNGL